MNKMVKRIALWAGIPAVVILALIPKFNAKPDMAKAPGAPGKKGPLTVESYIVQPELLNNSIVTTGTLLANEDVEIRSEISGRVERIFFREGANVAKGTLLVKINDAELRAQLRKAESKRMLAEQNEARQKKLLKIEGASQEEYDAALNELNAAIADVQLLRAQLEKTEIRAPFSGTIGLKYVSEGSFINSSTRIGSLQNINPIKIDFSVPEKYAPAVRVGNDLMFRVQSMSEKQGARIFAIEPQIDPATRTLRIRAVAPNTSGKFFPGAFADVELVMNPVFNALMIPTEALVPDIKGQKVFVMRSGKAQESMVQTGIRTSDRVQIVSGILPGDTVLTTGLLQLKPGMPVKLAKPAIARQ